MEMIRVTEKQEKYLKNIVYKSMSQREAYRDAYDCSRMSEKSIDTNASKLLKNTKVAQRYEELKAEKEGVEFFGLTEREEKFVEGLVLGKSQRESYKNAFNCKNCKDKTVDEKASRLFNTGKIKARFKQLQTRILQAAEKDAIMQGEEILTELSKIARSSLGDVIEVKVSDGSVEIGLKENIDMKNVKEMYVDKYGQIRIKMYSPIDAMKTLADLQNVKNSELQKDNEIVVDIAKLEGLGD